MAGNLLLGLGSAISDIWEKIGLDRSIGSKSLIPMMINSCENILKLGIPNSMAGPYVRGDVQTIKMHLEALKKNHSELLPLYVELAKTSIKYSNEKVGPEQTQAEEVTEDAVTTDASPSELQPQAAETPVTKIATLKEIEMEAIKSSVERNKWNMTTTAEELGISRMTLYRKLEQYGLRSKD